MDLLFFVFLLSCVLWYLRHKNYQYQGRKFVFKMHLLKDELRLLAYKGIVKEDQMYLYFSRTLDKVMASHEFLNLYSIVLFWYRHKNDERKDKELAIFLQYCDANPEVKELFRKYCSYISQYIKGQHITLALVLFPILTAIRVKRFCIEKGSNILKRLLVYPETSGASTMDLRSIYKRTRNEGPVVAA